MIRTTENMHIIDSPRTKRTSLWKSKGRSPYLTIDTVQLFGNILIATRYTGKTLERKGKRREQVSMAVTSEYKIKSIKLTAVLPLLF